MQQAKVCIEMHRQVMMQRSLVVHFHLSTYGRRTLSDAQVMSRSVRTAGHKG